MTERAAYLLMLVFLVMTGCKRQKITRLDDTLTSRQGEFAVVDALPDSLYQPLSFTYLSTRSKISIKSKNQNIDNASVSFRVRKDSAIWMSASTMGMEVIRAVLSREGVRMMDRFNKVYLAASYRNLAERLGFALDYPLLESMFLGEIPVYPGQKYELRSDTSQTLTKQSDAYVTIYNLIAHSLKKPVRMEALDLISGNQAKSEYSDFTDTIPKNVWLELTVKPRAQPEKTEQIVISVVHSGINLADSTLSFPFQVPNNFKKAF